MHFLLISLLAILAGTLLLIKTKKEALGKFFACISWFFIVVGFVLFLCFIGGSIYRLSHGGRPGGPGFRHEMMMKARPHMMMKAKCCPGGMVGTGCCEGGMVKGKCCPDGMVDAKCCEGGMMGTKCCEGGMVKGKCCPDGKMKGCCGAGAQCMMHDSLMKNCPMHQMGDSAKMVIP